MDATEQWRWVQAMRAIRARERLDLQTDINAGINPIQWQALRLHLADEAFDADAPEYINYVSGMAAERPVTISE